MINTAFNKNKLLEWILLKNLQWYFNPISIIQNPSHTEKSENIISVFTTLLNVMLASIYDCDKTLLALKLVVDLSPMLNVIVELLALLDPLEEG